MIRRALALLLIVMVSASALPLYAQEPVPPQTTTEKKAVVDKAIQKHHTVVVKFPGKRKKIEGTVAGADEESFVVVDRKTGESVRLAYTDVRQVKKKGLHPAAKAGIGIGIGFAVITTAAAIALRGD
jgi:hypothetical protein